MNRRNTLKLREYFNYLNATAESRCVREGEEVLNAGHIILCGKLNITAPKIHLCALCIQTSKISGHPHEIKGYLIKKNNLVTVDSMSCTCKAGNSGRCKHVSAVLLFCTRQSVEELEELSQTDLKCAWTSKLTLEKYKPTSIQEMLCLKDKILTDHQGVDKEFFYHLIDTELPNCSVALHRKGRSAEKETIIDIISDNATSIDLVPQILDHACQSIIMMEVRALPSVFMAKCCEDIFQALFNGNPEEICRNTISQRGTFWETERQFRITGSRCYSIFTYSKDDWDTKSIKYFWPKTFSNKNMMYGRKMEKQAKIAFQNITGLKIVDFGLIISFNNPWMGYSTDGVIFKGDKPNALIEIKSPVLGAKQNISEVIPTLSYLYNENGNFFLKEKHAYFAQIQLGMSILNLKRAYFVIYCSYDDSMHILKIKFDNEFSYSLLSNLKNKFFHKMLHNICINKK